MNERLSDLSRRLDVRDVEVLVTPGADAAWPARAAYRADVDGLRAVAVLSVILTHARIAGLSGGFVGVDMFFVISGYLIHRDLAARVGVGRFSLFAFYGRRMRRTLPALYLVCFATLGAALRVLMPGDLDEMAGSLLATILLVPNIFFLTQTGYFDAVAGTKPLLHTWSLGVEAQFYLFAPLLPFALSRLTSRGRRVSLAILVVVSLGGCVVLQRVAPEAAFYLMPARVFEFLIGVALVDAVVPSVRRPLTAEAMAVAGLIAIAISIGRFTDAMPYPGLPALLPCLGTAAIIHAGAVRRTLVGRLLGSRVAAFVGLISYSLYLWHWPILVLSNMADLRETPVVMGAQAVLLFGLSVISWRVVETPFRSPKSIWRRRAPMVLAAGASCLAGCAGLVMATRGLPRRFPPDVAAVAAYYSYRDTKPFREGRCFITSKDRLADFDRAACLKTAPGKPNVLLLGDSQAAQLWTGLRDTWPDVNVLQATASGCRPVVDATGSPRCLEMMREMFGSFIPKHRLDALVLGGIWETADIERIKRTIAVMKAHVGKIVVFGPMPGYDRPLPTLIAKAMSVGRPDEVSTHLIDYISGFDILMRDEIAPLATYVSPYQALCGRGRCRILAAPDVPMQFDDVHLTPEGGDVLMAAIRARQPSLFSDR